MLPFSRSSTTTTRGAGLFQIVAPRLSPCPSLVRPLASSSSIHAAAPTRRTPSSSSSSTANGVMTARDLQREITDLGEQLARLDKTRQVDEATRNLPPLKEEDLDAFYAALKAPDPPTPEEERQAARVQRRLESTAEPMSRHEAHLLALQHLSARLGLASIDDGSRGLDEAGELVIKETSASSLVDGITTLLASVKGEAAGSNASDEAPFPEANSPSRLPTGLVTRSEWKALAGLCANQGDDAALLRLVEAARLDPAVVSPIDLVDEAMDAHARKGDLARCQALLAHLESLSLSPTEHTHHSLVKAHLRAGLPDKAAELLHSLEEASTPAGLPTYTMVLSRVLSHRVPDARLQLWPMFHRMRMAAHPVPDAPLYALMIRACALGITPDSAGGEPDVERALDLFREMTTRYGVRPTAEAYNALILACARRKDMHGESLRLLREMVALERSRRESGLSGFAPDRSTYNALLQGCARTGDLLHARWALAEMLRSSVALWTEKGGEASAREADSALVEARRPDAQTLAAVFWTYASYRTPGAAPTTRTGEGERGAANAQSNSSAAESEPATKSSGMAVAETERPQGRAPPSSLSFTDSVPKTSAEVVAEVRGLMARIEADNEVPGGLLSTVRPSATLLHAYAAALAAHLPPSQRLREVEEIILGRPDDNKPPGKEEAKQASVTPTTTTTNSLFDRLGVKRQIHSYLVLLETAAKASDRKHADAVSDRAWALLEAFEDRQRVKLLSSSPRSDESSSGSRTPAPRARAEVLARRAAGPLSAGLTIFTTRSTAEALSSCYASRLHGLAKSHRLDEAMSLLRSFAQRYPVPPRPKVSRKPLDHLSSPDVGALSLLRPPKLFRASSTPTPWPRLTFKHLEMLHHRLVAKGASRRREVDFVHWLTTRTEASLRPAMPRLSAEERRRMLREEQRQRGIPGAGGGGGEGKKARRKKNGSAARAKLEKWTK